MSSFSVPNMAVVDAKRDAMAGKPYQYFQIYSPYFFPPQPCNLNELEVSVWSSNMAADVIRTIIYKWIFDFNMTLNNIMPWKLFCSFNYKLAKSSVDFSISLYTFHNCTTIELVPIQSDNYGAAFNKVQEELNALLIRENISAIK